MRGLLHFRECMLCGALCCVVLCCWGFGELSGVSLDRDVGEGTLRPVSHGVQICIWTILNLRARPPSKSTSLKGNIGSSK